MDIQTLTVALGYTKKQVEQAKREGFKVQVEQDRNILETTGEEKIFYFLPKNPQKPKDGYDEFVYANNNWEQVGVTDVDLSSCALKSEIPTKISQLQNDSGFLTEHQDISGKADKATTLAGYGITDAYKKIEINQMFNQVDADLQGKADAIDTYTKTQTDTLLNAKESTANKVTAVNSSASDIQYPTTKAVYDYGSQISSAVEDVKAYIGYTSSDILGLCVDLENRRFIRLAGAVGKTAGEDFDGFSMFGGRRRCNVADDGTINAFYGDAGYTEDGSNGQVMVYQPKFYYKVVPLKLEKQASGLGYHIRKANYYVTATPHAGFKVHPLFYDANGNEVEYVLLSAYEGSLYDVSESAYINDNAPGSYTYARGDLLCSVAGKKPVSGKLANIGTKANFEEMAQAHGTGWHLDTIKSVSANQLLMLIELGQFNTQAAIGQGVVSCPSNDYNNCSSYTGSTASLGNATGMATETTYESAGTETVNTTNGKLSVTYRGVENPWGNILKHTNGINLWGDGHMGGGQVFICDDFSFDESKHDGNYQSAGFTIPNINNGYISAFGHGNEESDWLFIPSETTGNSSLPVGDSVWCNPNLNNYSIALLGGAWSGGDGAGGFYLTCRPAPGNHNYICGGRLLYVPTATV